MAIQSVFFLYKIFRFRFTSAHFTLEPNRFQQWYPLGSSFISFDCNYECCKSSYHYFASTEKDQDLNLSQRTNERKLHYSSSNQSCQL